MWRRAPVGRAQHSERAEGATRRTSRRQPASPCERHGAAAGPCRCGDLHLQTALSQGARCGCSRLILGRFDDAALQTPIPEEAAAVFGLAGTNLEQQPLKTDAAERRPQKRLRPNLVLDRLRGQQLFSKRDLCHGCRDEYRRKLDFFSHVLALSDRQRGPDLARNFSSASWIL